MHEPFVAPTTDTPVGNGDQIYELVIAKGFGVTQNTLACFTQTPVAPEIGPGALRLHGGIVTVHAVAVHPLASVTLTQ